MLKIKKEKSMLPNTDVFEISALKSPATTAVAQAGTDRPWPTRIVAWFSQPVDILVVSCVYSKQPIFGLTLEWLRECGVHDKLHIYHLCGIFYFPWHRHQIEGTNSF